MDVLLVKRAQRRDMEAFVELMEKHKTGLYKVAKSYLRSEEDVADVMQETVLSAYEHIQELKTVSYFKTWITRILINHCKDLLKQQSNCLTGPRKFLRMTGSSIGLWASCRKITGRYSYCFTEKASIPGRLPRFWISMRIL